LTGVRVVDTIITEMAVFKVTPAGLQLCEIAPEFSVTDVCSATEAALTWTEIKPMAKYL
jgi:acyl CoA:acetate/3-ketoacid CoA transferase beta subunit